MGVSQSEPNALHTMSLGLDERVSHCSDLRIWPGKELRKGWSKLSWKVIHRRKRDILWSIYDMLWTMNIMTYMNSRNLTLAVASGRHGEDSPIPNCASLSADATWWCNNPGFLPSILHVWKKTRKSWRQMRKALLNCKGTKWGNGKKNQKAFWPSNFWVVPQFSFLVVEAFAFGGDPCRCTRDLWGRPATCGPKQFQQASFSNVTKSP